MPNDDNINKLKRFILNLHNISKSFEVYFRLSFRDVGLFLFCFIFFNVTYMIGHIYANSIFKYPSQNVYYYVNFSITDYANITDATGSQVTLSPLNYHKVVIDKFKINNCFDLAKLIPGVIDYSPPKLYVTSYHSFTNHCWYLASVNDFIVFNDLDIEAVKKRISNTKLIKLNMNGEFFELDLDYTRHQYIFPDYYGLKDFSYDVNKKVWLIFPNDCNNLDEEYLSKSIYYFLVFDWQRFRLDVINKLDSIYDIYKSN